ncbi:MAG TPA: hypothetical protein VFN31_03110 [Candidatus Saccharimonadales bacterium]|nr:hypothetical protein [Candidatus Saccharimonadales bacterium]
MSDAHELSDLDATVQLRAQELMDAAVNAPHPLDLAFLADAQKEQRFKEYSDRLLAYVLACDVRMRADSSVDPSDLKAWAVIGVPTIRKVAVNGARRVRSNWFAVANDADFEDLAVRARATQQDDPGSPSAL